MGVWARATVGDREGVWGRVRVRVRVRLGRRLAPWNSHTGTPCRPEAGLRMPPAATGAAAAKQPSYPPGRNSGAVAVAGSGRIWAGWVGFGVGLEG